MFTKLFSDGSACDTEMLKGPEIWRKKTSSLSLGHTRRKFNCRVAKKDEEKFTWIRKWPKQRCKVIGLTK